MAKLSRRGLLKTGAALAVSSAATVNATTKADAADRAGAKYNWGHSIDFGEQYFVRSEEILSNIRRTELPLIGDVSSRMAQCVAKGGKVFYDAYVGHMGNFECLEENKGNPGLITSNPKSVKPELLQAGDILVTSNVNAKVKVARDRGVYVVGVPVCYIDHEGAPRGFVTPNENGWLLADTSSVILKSYIPHTQGIVDCPQVPEMKICPSAASPLASLFWMVQCELANKIKNSGAKAVDKSAAFLDVILSRLRDAYRRQKDYIFDQTPTVAKRIAAGAGYHCTSDHAGVAREASGIANGPMMTNANRKKMKKGDVYLLATIEPDSPKILEEAKQARELEMFIISIAPASSAALRKQSDVFIDNLCPEGGGLLDVAGFPTKIGTAGGILNNLLMWIFTAQFIDEMVRRGHIPWFFMGLHQVGGKEYNQGVRPCFLQQGF